MFDEKFWLAIAFFAFIALLYKYLYSSLQNTLNTKTKKIADDIMEARKIRENAQRLFDEAQVFHKHSLEQSQKILENALLESKKIESEYKKNLDEEISKITNLAIERIKSEEEIAIRQVKNNIINDAINNISKLSLTETDHDKIINKSINKISQINI